MQPGLWEGHRLRRKPESRPPAKADLGLDGMWLIGKKQKTLLKASLLGCQSVLHRLTVSGQGLATELELGPEKPGAAQGHTASRCLFLTSNPIVALDYFGLSGK